MTTCAIMLCKDEVDVIETTLRHLSWHVDEIVVADNLSSDGTREVLEALHGRLDVPLTIRDDPEPGYWQQRKMTALAQEALGRGHRWIIPCDADEIWVAKDGRRLGDYLNGLAPDVLICKADLHDHIPTCHDDPAEANPCRRIGWRFVNRGGMPKVACQARWDLTIQPGNHAAVYQREPVIGEAAGLEVRHFTWRTEEQYLRKIRNGAVAYAATDLEVELGAHWRMHGLPDSPEFEDRVRRHFRRWFYVGAEESESPDPFADDRLVFDPAPLASTVP